MSSRADMAVFRLAARNSVSGNPRRCYVAMRGADIVGAWDEGYQGADAVTDPEARALAGACPTFISTPAQVRALVRGDWRS